jgi:hypothetical protein
VFSIRVKLQDGAGRWTAGLLGMFRRRKGRKEKPAPRAEPATEGERSLHQAMGWTANAWSDEG